MTTECKHARIQTWRFEDSAEVAGLWSCADCGRRFEPVAVAPVVRVPLTDDQIAGLLDRTFSDNTLQPDDIALIRAIEAAHGITAAIRGS